MIDFTFFSNPRLLFGPGKFKLLPELIRQYGKNVLFITGAESFLSSDHWATLTHTLEKQRIAFSQTSIKGEPTPAMVDGIVQNFCNLPVNVIVSIGGGSVIDAGKAVSAMMTKQLSVVEYLEDVGTQIHDGEKIPFIAIPTTSGTGSEATKNAVIRQVGKKGFKKSLRHNRFIPDIALVDPELTVHCPPHITAACGMDALTQLLESFVSSQASAMTDSLVIGALTVLGDSLINASTTEPENIDLRTRISYAAYISGLTLANAGLGVVHGFASVIGGLFNIPHGAVCGTLLAQTTRHTIETLIHTDPNGVALKKYQEAFDLLDPSGLFQTSEKESHPLVSLLNKWTDLLDMPTLGSYGVSFKDIDTIVTATGQKNNPAQLSIEQLSQILQTRL
ncbi:MAG: iron-containing alcohol dehydrogenase [Pseudomonadota bacterium]